MAEKLYTCRLRKITFLASSHITPLVPYKRPSFLGRRRGKRKRSSFLSQFSRIFLKNWQLLFTINYSLSFVKFVMEGRNLVDFAISLLLIVSDERKFTRPLRYPRPKNLPPPNEIFSTGNHTMVVCPFLVEIIEVLHIHDAFFNCLVSHRLLGVLQLIAY